MVRPLLLKISLQYQIKGEPTKRSHLANNLIRKPPEKGGFFVSVSCLWVGADHFHNYLYL